MFTRRTLLAGGLIIGAGVGTYTFYDNKNRIKLWLLPINNKIKYKNIYRSDTKLNDFQDFINSTNYSFYQIMYDEKVIQDCWDYVALRDIEDLELEIWTDVYYRNMEKVVQMLKEKYPDSWKTKVSYIRNPYLTPEELQKKYPGPYYKIVHPDRRHYDMTYSEEGGTYSIDKDLFTTNPCQEGGLHGANKQDIKGWFGVICRGEERCLVFDVDIPEDAICDYANRADKFKCSKLTLKNPRDKEIFLNE